MKDTRRFGDVLVRITDEVSKAIVGKGETTRILLIALIAGGHVLIEGYPGTAKTKLATSFAAAVGGKFSRIQFTPDMMPADVTGFYLYSPSGDSRFVDGPIFANVVLADELNRTTPRTQSALLEAMQENQVTIEKRTYPLEKPFMVVATQVQTGAEGTYPLTDVQADRFLFRILSERSSKDAEKEIMSRIDRIDEPDIGAVTTLEEILELQAMAKEIQVSADILEYVASIMDSVRSDPDVLFGPSIRAGIAMFKGSRVLAAMDERDFVIPDDIKHLAHNALEHRTLVRPEAEMDDITPGIVVDRVLEKVPVPKIEA